LFIEGWTGVTNTYGAVAKGWKRKTREKLIKFQASIDKRGLKGTTMPILMTKAASMRTSASKRYDK